MEAGTNELIVGWSQPLHWAASGALIGGITLWLLYRLNHALGISTGFENLCALWSKQVYFCRERLHGRGMWRIPFLMGLVLGGVLSRVSLGGWSLTWNLGMWDSAIGWDAPGKMIWMVVGGFLIGFGTRMAGGCTSGHGIFGISNFEKASYVATISFMVAGMITTQLVYGVFASVGP